MAAPPTKTMRQLSGRWRLNHTLSDPMERFMAVQGVPWVVRKTASMITMTLILREYEQQGAPWIRIDQTATGGLKLPSEDRAMDWRVQEREDATMGAVKSRARYVDKLDGLNGAAESLRQGWAEEDHAEVKIESAKGHDMVQVLGFEKIGGGRYLVIRAIITRKGESERMRCVYDWIGE